MKSEKAIIGFLGAGGIARAHAYAIKSLPYYYNDAPAFDTSAVCSEREESRNSFASKYGFTRSLSFSEFTSDKNIDTVYILGPNKVHLDHFRAALEMPSIKRIYIEKPVCSGADQETIMRSLSSGRPDIRVQAGFQYLFAPAISGALQFWLTGLAGKPIHFDFSYKHGDYLGSSYREKRKTRLTPAPDGGAMADLGSHALSLMTAFLGNDLSLTSAVQSGSFPDVDSRSDLFSLITLHDKKSGAAGTLSASRVSQGTGDLLSFEIYAEKGSLRYSTQNPDSFEYFLETEGTWNRKFFGNSYANVTSFPSGHVPAGWLRSMIHAHYVFLTGNSENPVLPGIEHSLRVQQLVNNASDHMRIFRSEFNVQ